ncbi:N-terminal half of MaoC dehydratase [Solimonas aquatica]|uniref:N-terminal half of MaoC dehydratase n=1 Tax=Solimonas aquatica TaxID=489703 RepID=A0A1H9GCD6_9GAMM|nr:MaoC family dehydratase N-terminal domain-containing protein [Solimonas aquatica]SEQ47740.1 N-terminal half of MaoC dehydratase [Solimonas aquatica]
MLDKAHIGLSLPAHTVEVEKGRLRFFAKAIGETRAIYLDESAAQAAGYRSLPVPPTFLFSLDLEQAEPFAWFGTVGLSLPRILHGEQSFVYHAPACAGDVLSFHSQIADIYDKKNGLLEFVVKQTRVSDQHGRHIADLRSVIVQRNS